MSSHHSKNGQSPGSITSPNYCVLGCLEFLNKYFTKFSQGTSSVSNINRY